VPVYLVYIYSFIYPNENCLFIKTITNISFIFSRVEARSKFIEEVEFNLGEVFFDV